MDITLSKKLSCTTFFSQLEVILVRLKKKNKQHNKGVDLNQTNEKVLHIYSNTEMQKWQDLKFQREYLKPEIQVTP